MFCVRCGKALKEGMAVCPTCQAPVPARNPGSRPTGSPNQPPSQMSAGHAVAQQKDQVKPRNLDELLGHVVAGRYRLLEKLGKGGMGTVFKAEDMQTKRLTALKILSFDLLDNPEFVARFEREAQTSAHINHPNAVNTFDSGRTQDGIIYIAMEYLDGRSLSSVIKERAPLPLNRAIAYTHQAAAALDAGHKLGIVHRDFKPDNAIILREPDGSERLKVLDFGVAKQTLLDAEAQKLTRTGFMIGTPQYVSPEQLQGQPIGPPSDLYSLAVVVYQMLTGSLPFVGNTPQKQMLNRMTQDPMPFSHVNPDLHLPSEVEAVLMKAMARNASDRYSSTMEFAAELERASHIHFQPGPHHAPQHEAPPPAAYPSPPPMPYPGNAPYPQAGQGGTPVSNKMIWIVLAAGIIVAAIALAIFLSVM